MLTAKYHAQIRKVVFRVLENSCSMRYITPFIGRIHGAIVAAIVGAIVAASIACSVYTRRLSWRSARQSSPRRSTRQSPRVYTTGDRRDDEHSFGYCRRDDRL